jgi:hypothetical protein
MVAAPIIVFLLIAPVLLFWLGEFLANGPAEEIRGTKRHPFAGDPFDN